MNNPTFEPQLQIHKVTMDIYIRQDQVLLYYKGILKRIRGVSRGGQIMDLPFDMFMSHVSNEGLSGTFEITYTSRSGSIGRLVQLRKLS